MGVIIDMMKNNGRYSSKKQSLVPFMLATFATIPFTFFNVELW
jgi:hypothetical protein